MTNSRPISVWDPSIEQDFSLLPPTPLLQSYPPTLATTHTPTHTVPKYSAAIPYKSPSNDDDILVGSVGESSSASI